jgi:hydroxymethylpyrimidine pyrophosphatase-like HAD family hydrolase
MRLTSIILQLLYFVTDCDKTLVHYDVTDEEIRDIPLTLFPASAKSKRVGAVSLLTSTLLQEISSLSEGVICASGMRSSTMLQRQTYFPFINYWICENGGRIYRRKDEKTVVEVPEWHEYLETHHNLLKSMQSLASFATRLRAESNQWIIDTTDYVTMVRIHVAELSQKEIDTLLLLANSFNLHYTYNLDFLDVYVPGSGKQSAVSWLLNYLGSSSAFPTSASYYFMGDDTNDIESAEAAVGAAFVQPCSVAVSRWMMSSHPNLTLKRIGPRDSPAKCEESMEEWAHADMLPSAVRRVSSKVFTTEQHTMRFKSSETLLQSFRLILNQQGDGNRH